MEPEDGLDEHVHRCDRIIPVADVTQFMGDDSLQLGRRQSLKDAFGQQQDRPEDTEHARLQGGGGAYGPNRHFQVRG